MASTDPSLAILRARIRIALRRACGAIVEVDAKLADAASAQASLAEWRLLGNAELNALLDQYELVSTGGHPAPAAPASGAGAAPASAKPGEDPPPKPGRRYLRGAR